MQALPLVLVVVLVIVAAATFVFLRRRRHAATAARLAAASSPVPELSEDDIAWRIGLLDDRPILLSEFFAGAENEAMEAAEQELGTPILPVLQEADAPGDVVFGQLGDGRRCRGEPGCRGGMATPSEEDECGSRDG